MKLQNYENTEEAVHVATMCGFEVVEADDNTLLLDIDNVTDMGRYLKCLSILEKIEGATEEQRWKSKSGNGWHIVVKLKEPRKVEARLRLQSLLGSDPVRESLHWKSFNETGDVRILLFKPPTK